MGIELDILTGHPDHERLFIATQVARAVGLRQPSAVVRDYRRTKLGADAGRTLMSVMGNFPIKDIPKDPAGRRFKGVTVLFTESVVYEMLLASVAPQTEPFRKWVTLPVR